jgi:hypothetical protein
MDFKQYAKAKQADLPTLLVDGDKFERIDSMQVKTIDYQGKPTEVGTITTDHGVFGTFSGVLIKTLREYFAENHEPLTNVKIVKPRGKTYLTLESTN